MNFQNKKNSLIILVFFLLISSTAFAQKVQKKELYHSGKQAYDTGKYSEALVFFEEFVKFNSAYLTKHNGLKNSLKGAIAICKRHVREEKLREEELSKRNTSSHFSVAAMHKAPVLYYKPQALMVSDEEKKRLNKGNRSALFGYVDFLEKHPFKAIVFHGTSSFSSDEKKNTTYVVSKVKLIQKYFEKKGISKDRILIGKIAFDPSDIGLYLFFNIEEVKMEYLKEEKKVSN